MANMQAGFSTGLQGAQMGGQLGGAYGAAIGGIAGFALGADTPDYEKIAREKYNAEVLKNFTKSLFDSRKVQNIENIRTAQALAAYQDNLRVAGSTYNASYGAADMIGSSTTALAQAMDFQTNEAKRATMLNWETQLDNMNTNIDALANQAQASLRRTKGDRRENLGAMVKTGLDLYSQYRGSFNNPFSNPNDPNALKGLTDFGSYGKSGTVSGNPSMGSLFG